MVGVSIIVHHIFPLPLLPGKDGRLWCGVFGSGMATWLLPHLLWEEVTWVTARVAHLCVCVTLQVPSALPQAQGIFLVPRWGQRGADPAESHSGTWSRLGKPSGVVWNPGIFWVIIFSVIVCYRSITQAILTDTDILKDSFPNECWW